MANKIGIISELGTDSAPKYPTQHNARELKLAETMLANANIDETFDTPLVWSSVDQEGHLISLTAPAAGDEVAFRTGKHNMLMHIVAINGTAIQSMPYVSADGLELNVDDDATDGTTGLEIATGILPLTREAMTVGQADFIFQATVTIDDISDVTELTLGLRKAEAFQAATDNYDEMAAFNIGEDADGQIEIHTILNGGATTDTDTTLTDWIDAGTHTMKIIVRKNGKCEFFFDGATPTVTAAFTFDAGEILIPFIHVTCETGDPGISVSSLKAGKL